MPLVHAPADEQAAARAGYFSSLRGDRRLVPPEYGWPIIARSRWLQGYDAAAYQVRRARTSPRPEDLLRG